MYPTVVGEKKQGRSKQGRDDLYGCCYALYVNMSIKIAGSLSLISLNTPNYYNTSS